MAFSSGVFSRLYSWTTDKLAGTKIRADRMDAEFDGIATGLSTCILKDGTQTITAAIPFNNQNITGVNGLTAVTVTTSGASTATAFIPSASTVPTNGMYLPAANTVGFAINSAGEVQLTATALSPITNDGLALGTTALQYSDLFLAEGGVINWDNGDATLTQANNLVTLAGAALSLTDSTASTNTTTGALIVNGGVGVGGAMNVGGDIVAGGAGSTTARLEAFSGASAVTTVGFFQTSVAEWGIGMSSGDSIFKISHGGQPGTGTSVLTLNTTGQVAVPSNTASTSSATGALVVTGGVGVGGAIFSGSVTTGAATISAASPVLELKTTGTTEQVIRFTTAGTNNWTLHALDNSAFRMVNRAGTSGVELINQAATSWSAISSRRIKDDIEELRVLDKIEQFAGVSYRNKLTNAHEIGVIADDFVSLWPELVAMGSNEDDGSPVVSVTDPRLARVAYDRIGPIALQGVKQLWAWVQKLGTRVSDLEARIAALEARL